MNTNRICPGCQKPLALDAPMGLCPECLIKAGFPTGLESESPSASPSEVVAPAVEEIARLFPQLEVLELIGKGGMGVVYKARQKQLNRLVALKILPSGLGREPSFAERFTREAQALAALNHPNIVTLHEYGQAGGQHYFLMEYVDGVNLRQLLQAGRVSPREALAIVPQICDALQFAHDQGIVHRDIKPENILLDRRGRVKVADFGLAKIVGGNGHEPDPDLKPSPGSPALTDAGRVMGTPSYMSPEQREHPSEVDHRADIYALGVVFYQMLTGELPGQRIEPPSHKVHIDVRLDEVVLRALEQRPELRYQQASVLKTRVEALASKMGDTAAATGGTAWKSPTSGWGYWVGRTIAITFTSPKAYRCANLSALGFLGFLGFLGYLPVAGSPYLFSLFGFFGLFGLIGAAAGIEFRERRDAEMKNIFANMNALPVVNLSGPLTLEAWLALVDAGDYARSWDTAAPNLRIHLKREDWIGRLQKTRQPLGTVLTRRLKDTRLTEMGSVFEAIYATAFDGLSQAAETVAFTKQADGQWQPSGYSVEPVREHANFNSRRAQLFNAIMVAVFLVLVATGSAWAMMIGSGLWLVVGLIWFAAGKRRLALLAALGAALIATWTILVIKTVHLPAPKAAWPASSTISITRADVDGNKVVIEGTAPTGARFALYAGRRENGWSCGFSYPDQFTASLEQGLTGLICRVQPRLGKPALTMDGAKSIGDVNLSDGKLVFRAGQPQQEADGTWSVTIGEFTAKSGKKIPVGVLLLPPRAEDLLPGQLTQEGWQLWQAGKMAEAVAKFQQAIQLAPSDANAWNGLGWAQFNSGQSAPAEIAFQKAVGIQPDLPGALNGLGQIYLTQRRCDEAEAYLLRAAPQAGAAWFGLARLYLLQGRFDEAAKWAQNIVDAGQADDISRQMLEAARTKSLTDSLRQIIEPPPAIQVMPEAKTETPAPSATRPGQLEFRWIAAESDTLSPTDVLPDPDDRSGHDTLRVLRTVVLDEQDVTSAEFTRVTGIPDEVLLLRLKAPSAQRFGNATAINVGRKLAVVWRGRILSAPRIQAPVAGDSIQLNVKREFGDTERAQLLDLLNRGTPAKPVGD